MSRNGSDMKFSQAYLKTILSYDEETLLQKRNEKQKNGASKK